MDGKADTPLRRATVIVWALLEGYAAERCSMYDEEGIEGWEWTDPAGRELGTEMGAHDELPSFPEGLFELLNARCPWRTEEASNETRPTQR